jgi:hypothetical protein
MKPISRRDWLQGGAPLSGAPCACLAQASDDCCVVPEVPLDGLRIQPGLVTIDLDRTPVLHRTGAAVKIIDPARKLNVIGAPRRIVSLLDQKCTHGGGALTHKPTQASLLH